MIYELWKLRKKKRKTKKNNSRAVRRLSLKIFVSDTNSYLHTYLRRKKNCSANVRNRLAYMFDRFRLSELASSFYERSQINGWRYIDYSNEVPFVQTCIRYLRSYNFARA